MGKSDCGVFYTQKICSEIKLTNVYDWVSHENPFHGLVSKSQVIFSKDFSPFYHRSMQLLALSLILDLCIACKSKHLTSILGNFQKLKLFPMKESYSKFTQFRITFRDYFAIG